MKNIILSIRDTDHCKRLSDPQKSNVFHLETLLPFSEAIKLERGNANVRPPKGNAPYKAMMETIEQNPDLFHLKNRGITYICSKFSYDNAGKKLTIQIPRLSSDELNSEEDGVPRYGIADGGHTFKAIEDSIQSLSKAERANEDDQEPIEPFVRIRFISLAEDGLLEQIVEALNTSTQVKNYTMAEYKGKFDALEEALRKSGFDTSLIAFRENEDEKEWNVTEVIQRGACFLKERWRTNHPTNMYRSKEKALQFFTSDPEFEKLFDVIRDIVTLPEFIQQEFGNITGGSRKLGKLRGVKTLAKPFTRPGTTFQYSHKMDMALLLPITAAFRELLVLNKSTNRYEWKANPHEFVRSCASEMYDILAQKNRRAKSAAQLGNDSDYWGLCSRIALQKASELK